MNDAATAIDALREQILAKPDVILEDREIMSALVGAREEALGDNVVDLRGVAMQRLESRLDRLEDTHRTVIAAAYDNVSGTHQIHRAVLALLEPATFDDFVATLETEICNILRVDCVRLVLESAANTEAALPGANEIIRIVKPGYVDHYLTEGQPGAPLRPVTLRALPDSFGALYDGLERKIRSEAALKLDLGDDRLPGLVLMGAEDLQQFRSDQGTDLLDFLGGVFERQMKHWLL